MDAGDALDYESYFPSVSSRTKKRVRHSRQNHENSSSKRPRAQESTANDENEAENAIEVLEVNQESDEFNELEIPILHRQKVQKPTEEQLQELREAGIPIKTGIFSSKENVRIMKNYQDYMQRFGGQYADLFGVGRKGKTIRQKLYKMTLFYQRLAHGLPHRHIWYVYLHARKICHPNHEDYLNARRYTGTETQQLLSMVKTHGNDFITIGAAMNRTADSVCWRYLHMTSPKKRGPFSDDELLKLIMCVSDVHGIRNLNQARYLKWNQIQWAKVVQMMEDRDYNQCRCVWKYLVLPDCLIPTRQQTYFLCCLVRQYGRDSDDIDWDQIARDIGIYDGYIAKTHFQKKKRHLLRRYFPETNVTTVSNRSAAKKLMRQLRQKYAVRCFHNVYFDWDETLCDIAGLDSYRNLSWED